MTEGFGRRAVLAIAGAAAIQFATPAFAQPGNQDNDEGVFARLSGLFVALVEATDPIAEGITKIKFTRFLNSMIGPLSDIAQQKRAVLAALELNACGADAARFQDVARSATGEILRLAGTLGTLTRTLATAIKPGGTRNLALRTESELRNVINGKFWIDDINRYCSMSPAQKSAFRANVARSSASVSRCRTDLERLLETLSN